MFLSSNLSALQGTIIDLCLNLQGSCRISLPFKLIPLCLFDLKKPCLGPTQEGPVTFYLLFFSGPSLVLCLSSLESCFCCTQIAFNFEFFADHNLTIISIFFNSFACVSNLLCHAIIHLSILLS